MLFVFSHISRPLIHKPIYIYIYILIHTLDSNTTRCATNQTSSVLTYIYIVRMSDGSSNNKNLIMNAGKTRITKPDPLYNVHLPSLSSISESALCIHITMYTQPCGQRATLCNDESINLDAIMPWRTTGYTSYNGNC